MVREQKIEREGDENVPACRIGGRSARADLHVAHRQASQAQSQTTLMADAALGRLGVYPAINLSYCAAI